jgi:hypothetical protein
MISFPNFPTFRVEKRITLTKLIDVTLLSLVQVLLARVMV